MISLSPQRLMRPFARVAGALILPAAAAAAAGSPAALASAVCLTCLVAPHALAQVKDVAPYYAVVTADATPLRCADITGAYRVAELAKGQVVQADGEGPDWVRVAYPSKTTAFIKADEAQADTAAGTVKLTSPSKLKAANAISGFGASWKSLFADPLPAGTSLKLVETVKADDGQVQGFRVVAPDSARGFISPGSLRKATEAEIATYKKSTGAATETKPTVAAKPEPAKTTPPKAEPAKTEPPKTDPAPADHTPATPPADTSLLKPITPDNGAAPAPVDPQPIPAPVASPQPAQPEQPAARAVGSLEALEASFQKVRKEPVLQAELDPLIAEFERTIDNTDKSKYPRRYAQLEQRRNYLKLQVDYRDNIRNIEETKRRIDDARNQSQQRIAELEAQRVYTVVGQLLPSNVYDGKDLPLMYRLQSVGGLTPRTLGYLKPQEQLQIPTKLGMVVGVIGQATIDPSLRLNIFDPVRVDVLKAADTVAPASNSAQPENPPAPAPSADGSSETPQ